MNHDRISSRPTTHPSPCPPYDEDDFEESETADTNVDSGATTGSESQVVVSTDIREEPSETRPRKQSA